MLAAVPVEAPLLSVVMPEPRSSTVMPSFKSSRLRPVPSASLTLATLSSKRTPFTMTEPKPVMGPLTKEVALPPVPPLSTPPPQATRNRHGTSVRHPTRTRHSALQICRKIMVKAPWAGQACVGWALLQL